MESVSRAEQEISLAALQQHDPYITSIADVTGQVALYSFSPKANEWVSPEKRARLFQRPGRTGWRRRSPRQGIRCRGRGSGRLCCRSSSRPDRDLLTGFRRRLLSTRGRFGIWVPDPAGVSAPKGAYARRERRCRRVVRHLWVAVTETAVRLEDSFALGCRCCVYFLLFVF